MKIAVTSDTHGDSFLVPKCDVFIHCGDFTAGGSLKESRRFIKEFSRDPEAARHILLVPGNHDEAFQKHTEELRALCGKNVHILIDEGIEIEGKTFWGSPWTPPFMQWFFMADEDLLEVIYRDMPEKLDFLITHGPPYGILDPGFQALHVGSKSLREAIAGREIKNHVFGHLHAAGGISRSYQWYITDFHNVSACNEAYQLVRSPLIIEM